MQPATQPPRPWALAIENLRAGEKVANEAAPELVQAMDDSCTSVSAAVFLLSPPRDQQAVAAQDHKQTPSRKSQKPSNQPSRMPLSMSYTSSMRWIYWPAQRYAQWQRAGFGTVGLSAGLHLVLQRCNGFKN